MGDETFVGGRYRLGTPLGRGGMAEVLLGLDVRLCRAVAVKRLRRELATDPGARELFEREARFAGGLNHPNIVAVYDAGESGDPAQGATLPYLVLELATGRSLKELMHDGQTMSPRQALQVTEGLLAALAHTHAAGLVHCDVKPANVVLTLDGDAKLTDFGIARRLDDDPAGPLGSSDVRGTTRYLAPERFRGGPPDPRSDLYSVGCLLYHLVVGHPPFLGGSTGELARHHLLDAPTPPSQLDPSLDPRLDALVLTALAKDPADRYQSAEEMRRALRSVLAGEPVPSTVTTSGVAVLAAARRQRAAASSRAPRRRTLVAAGIAAMLVPGAGIVIRSVDLTGGSIEQAGAAAALSLPWAGSGSGRPDLLADQAGAVSQSGAAGLPPAAVPAAGAGSALRSTLLLGTTTGGGASGAAWSSSTAAAGAAADGTPAAGGAAATLPGRGVGGDGQPAGPGAVPAPAAPAPGTPGSTTPPTTAPQPGGPVVPDPTVPGRPPEATPPPKTTPPGPVTPPAAPRPPAPDKPPAAPRPPAPDKPPAAPKPVTAPKPSKPSKPTKPVEAVPGPKPVPAPEPAKPPKATKPVKPVKPPKATKPPKPGKPAEVAKPPKPAKPNKPATAPRPEEPSRPSEPVKPPEAAKPDKPGKPENPGKPDKGEKPGKPDKDEKPGKPDKAEKPHKP